MSPLAWKITLLILSIYCLSQAVAWTIPQIVQGSSLNQSQPHALQLLDRRLTDAGDSAWLDKRQLYVVRAL